ncbi:MAG TPA: hypothetical protein VLT33_02580, partial [Labilithrix sp.]|nr:hypothetical protein [Labilithrix sp.]
MAMQQSSKGASGSGSSPALSDEQAEQFAASFTPAWDADDGLGDSTSGTPDATVSNTQVMDRAELAKAQEAPPIVGTPAIIFNAKSTMIGVPPPGHLAARPSAAPAVVSVPPAAPSAEAVDPENVLEVRTAPAAPVAAAAPAAPAVHQNHGMRTQIMQNRPSGPGPTPAVQQGAATIASRPPAERTGTAAAVAVDPFRSRGASSADESDAFPKRSNKTVLFVVAGLAVAAGLGLFLKFALGDDAPKPPPSEVVTGPAVTTAEIPPPPPKEETPPAAATAAAVTAAKTAEP